MKIEHNTGTVDVVDPPNREPVHVSGLRVIDDRTIEIDRSLLAALGGDVTITVVGNEPVADRLVRLTELARETWPDAVVSNERGQLTVRTLVRKADASGRWGEPAWHVHILFDGDDESDYDALECALVVEAQH